MLTAFDRHLGLNGGETIALVTVLCVFAYVTFPHVPQLKLLAEQCSQHLSISIR